jgi:hypothetical protein
MKSGFNDPIKSTVKTQQKKSPWDFRCPQYDERSSCYVNAGSHWGIGHRQPVGHSGNPSRNAPTLPYGRVSTMETDEIPKKNLDQEYLL